MDGGHPTIDYMGDVCGTGSFTGYFILSGDARLAAGTEQLVDAGSVSGAWTVDAPTGPVPDVLTNGGAEAFKISLPDMTPRVGSGSAIGSGGASLGGVVFWISGQLSRPIEFSGSVMGLAGPKKTMVWPLLGAFDQLVQHRRRPWRIHRLRRDLGLAVETIGFYGPGAWRLP